MDFDSLYTQICFNIEKSGGGRGTSSCFSNCSSDSQRISFVLGLESVKACLHEPLYFAKQKIFTPCKSKDQSTSHRIEGDGYYQKKSNWKAICSYNRSLLVGEGEALAFTYANRSAVFYDTEDWLHSLRDIQLALDQGYPKHLEHKLRERQGDCWLELGHVNQALISFNLARDLLLVSPTAKQQKDKLSDLVLKLKQTKNKHKKAKKCGLSENELISSVKSIEQEVIKKRRSAPELYRARNTLLPSASTSIELKNTADRGRCLVANEDIEIGATVIVEKAHASILLEEFKESHCHNCLHWTPGIVPCHQCSKVGFCSTQCRDEAWASYHQSECGLTDFLHQTMDVNSGQHGLLALRTILKADKQKIITANEQEKSFVSCASQMFDSANYETVHHLVDNTSQRSTADIFRRAVMAVYLTSLIQQRDGKDRPDEVLATAVLRLLQSYPCNAHEISHLAIPLPSGLCSHSKLLQLQQVQSCEIGSAAFPVVSLMNHSCNPNVVHICYGDVMVVKVIRRIARGEEILDNYGYHYATHEKRERQVKLCQQYYFRCRCQPCLEDWPLYGDTPKLTNRPDIADRITKDINDFKRLSCCYPEGCSQMEESARLFISYLDAMESDPSINLPVQEYNKAQEGLKHCLALSATLSPHLVV